MHACQRSTSFDRHAIVIIKWSMHEIRHRIDFIKWNWSPSFRICRRKLKQHLKIRAKHCTAISHICESIQCKRVRACVSLFIYLYLAVETHLSCYLCIMFFLGNNHCITTSREKKNQPHSLSKNCIHCRGPNHSGVTSGVEQQISRNSRCQRQTNTLWIEFIRKLCTWEIELYTMKENILLFALKAKKKLISSH